MSRRNFEAVVMDTVYAVIHVELLEYMFIAHILIYILHKYWMCNSISPFCDVASGGVIVRIFLLFDNNSIPSSKVWHRCRFKPPNCRLARAARVVCAQPGTVVCSQTPLSLVVCRSGGGGGFGWLVLSTCLFKSNCIDIKAWLDHHSLLLMAQIKLTLKYLSIRYILQIMRHRIISTNFYLFKPPACSIFQDGGICKFVNRMSDFRLKSLIQLTT